MIAEKIGLSKLKRSQVGICGLFHDLGMLAVGESIRNHAGPLSADQWGPIWKHPAEGAKMLLRTERIVEAMTRAMQATFYHQMRDDEMGYPQLGQKKEMDVLTRIVKVADAFDAMVHDRPYRNAMTEAQALQELLSLTDTVYERVFIKILANALGVYPVGVSVKLNTGEVGKVHQDNPDLDYQDKPVVRIYADAHGRKIDKVVDLMEKEAGVFKYWIVPFDEKELDLDVSDFISIM
jgi:HD-GYP domain-containing protein (c-di-GMP phosphodiesterase class II)